MRLTRVLLGITIASLLTLGLYAWGRLAAGASPLPSQEPPPLTLHVDEHTLRPTLRAPHALQAVWSAPPLSHASILRQNETTLTLLVTPTGAQTAACAYTVTLRWDGTTWTVRESPTPCATQPLTAATWLPTPVPEPRPYTNTLLPPPVIRVRHDPRNTCRQVPPGQVDVIPFEEYVARVLPAEMPALWPEAALRAQAIAIRTYAWYHILQGRPDFDVSDWSDYQVMCDTRHPRADAAVLATAGQVLTYNGLPILAMYSAQNGHPTLGVPWLPYLTPVPDPVSLGQPRRGHGLGLSQWGAKFWADRGWDAYQILAHYYPGTRLYVPPETSTPVGALLPPELENMTLGHGYPLYALVGSATPVQAITITARTATGETFLILTRTAPITTWLGTWEPPLTFSSSQPITLTAAVVNAEGQKATLAPVTIWRDLRPLSVTVDTVTQTVDPRLTVTLNTQTPFDVPLAVGLSDNWTWEERAFKTNPPGAGQIISDTLALDGNAWQHPRGAGEAILYGPYTNALEPGRSYRAWFRLRAGDVSSPNVVAFLDVVEDDGQTLLGLRALRGIEFPAADTYREFPVDFHIFPREDGRPRRVEFRVHARGVVTLTLDRVLVTTYPQPLTTTTRWAMPQYPGIHPLAVKGVGPSGLPTGDVPLSITLNMPSRPLAFLPRPPAGWITQPISITWQVTTAVAPPDPATFAYRYSTGDTWSAWHPITPSNVHTRAATLALPTTALPDAAAVRVQVRGSDRYTYRGESTPITLAVDLNPPQLRLLPDASPGPTGWFTRPLTVTLHAQDAGSGLATVTFADRTFAPESATFTTTWRLAREGIHTLYAQATDNVGHTSAPISQTFALDLTPPTTTLFAPPDVRALSFKVHWVAQDRSGIAGYDVALRREGASWRTWLSNTQQTTATYTGQPGERVSFRARARDRAGWVGPWSAPVTVTLPYLNHLPALWQGEPPAPSERPQ